MWANVTASCLRKINTMPETILAETLFIPRPTQVRILGGDKKRAAELCARGDVTPMWGYPPQTYKEMAEQPTLRAVWHSHNRTNVARWIERREGETHSSAAAATSRPGDGLRPWLQALRRLPEWTTLPTWSTRQWAECLR